MIKNAPLPFLQASTRDFRHTPCYWTLRQEAERPQRTASNPCRPQPFFTCPEVQLQLGSPERWDETRTGKRAGGPLTSLQLALPESSQALTRFKWLQVHGADCVSTSTTHTASPRPRRRLRLHVHDADCVSTSTTQTASPGARRRLRLHVHDADCVSCADPTTNGTRRQAPSANQRQAAMSSRPPTSSLSYPTCSRSRPQSADPSSSGWRSPLDLGVQG